MLMSPAADDGLSGLGIAVTAGTYASLGAAAPGRIGLTMIKAARKIDARTEPTPQSMGIGEVALGASIGVALEVRGASCNETDVQRRTWTGEPIDFSFVVEAGNHGSVASLCMRTSPVSASATR